ncbi:DegT/DnrJ/EryC1/StrS family aminotransferase [uncultured Proteiniphilum sp.]|uniref:DegT/DnrJ/EryC1/StrS family aminotransferase n=1 Tax=uncultured Proteiniphilum sp. TaxID=497637 RepID=UPI0026370D62|nr:DegT/DnrJ/EryC1/StrS family aminotransferase [uncultured Proteiniphilum sp.]
MKKISRRLFLGSVSIVGTGMVLRPGSIWAGKRGLDAKPALLGGEKTVTKRFPRWPFVDTTEEKALLGALHGSGWGRRVKNNAADNFEKNYAKLLGADHCLTVNSGTSALFTMMGALDIGPGDEVILPVYTFIATYNAVVLHNALPIIVDIDPESFQIDPKKMEAAITKETKALMPVHIGGSPANLDAILEIGDRNNLPVIEDACQAHLAEWKGKKVGTFGIGGAFSFQESKNLNCGQGGAITTNNRQFMDACVGFHHQGAVLSDNAYAPGGVRGGNLRMTEFQAAILNAQMTRLEQQAKKRSENAAYLNKMLNEIPGMAPAKLYPGTTNSAYHLYMCRYDSNYFSGMGRARFIEALSAEGIPCSAGYGQMEKTPRVTALAKSRHYLKIYGEKTMKNWLERIQCPQNAKVSTEIAVWFGQTVLLGSKTDMEQIAEAIRKIQKYAKEIKDKAV